MVISCDSGAAGADCDSANDKAAMASVLFIALFINRDAIGIMTDRHRFQHLVRGGVDDADIVAAAIGDEEPLLVLVERDAPGARADQDIVDHLMGFDIDDADMIGAAL